MRRVIIEVEGSHPPHPLGEKKTTKKTNGLIGVPGSSAITFPEYTRSQITISWRVSDDGGMQMSNWTIFFSSYNATWNIISFPANTSQYPHYLFSCFMALLDVSRNKFLGLNASTVYRTNNMPRFSNSMQ